MRTYKFHHQKISIMNHHITDAVAYKRGFDRGYTLCINMKKITVEFSAVLRSVVSKDFQNSYGIGVKDGYNTGLQYIKRELVDEKLKQKEVELQKNKQPIDLETSFKSIMRLQTRQADMRRIKEKQQERERDDHDLER